MGTPQVAESMFWKHLGDSGLMPSADITAAKREWTLQHVVAPSVRTQSDQPNDAKIPVDARGADNAPDPSDASAADFLVKQKRLTRFQADRLLEGRARGFFFDQYKVIDLLGLGGMGWVYLAEDTNTGQKVAMKVLLDQFRHDRGMLVRFQQEAKITLKLDHPNIVKTIALGSAGGSYYMIMEFIEGPSLLEVLLRAGKLKWSHACEIVRQAALGLHYAHGQGLIHRDIKPQNLLIDRAGTVKLLDFGLSMVDGGESGDEFSMAMIFGHDCVGTAAYMSPEQANDSYRVDAKSDIYSLGCTLYASLVGDTPFPEKSVTDVQKAHKIKAPRSVRELASNVPEGVAQIVTKMLAKNPADRYATAAEVADALAKFAKPVSEISFNFESIIRERKQAAQQKMAELLRSKTRAGSSTSSTARPKAISSVVTIPLMNQTFRPAETPFGASGRVLPRPTESLPKAPSSPDVSSTRVDVVETRKERQQPRATKIEVTGASLVPVGGEPEQPLTQREVLIGYNDDCSIRLSDSKVSGHHCKISFDGIRWWITDLGSRNGTKVNGIPIKHRPLKSRDKILIAKKFEYRFNCPEPVAEKQRLRHLLWITAGAVTALLLAFAGWFFWR